MGTIVDVSNWGAISDNYGTLPDMMASNKPTIDKSQDTKPNSYNDSRSKKYRYFNNFLTGLQMKFEVQYRQTRQTNQQFDYQQKQF